MVALPKSGLRFPLREGFFDTMRKILPKVSPLQKFMFFLMESGMALGASMNSRYMSTTYKLPSGALAKLQGRNQGSVEAKNSRFRSSGARLAMKVTPSGDSTSR